MVAFTSILKLFNDKMNEPRRVLSASLMVKLAASKPLSPWAGKNSLSSSVNLLVSMTITLTAEWDT
jgi:hypothetical protein